MKTARILISLLVVCPLFTYLGSQVAQAAVHPSLYFTQEELVNLKALKTAPSHQAIWNNIESWANAHLADAPLAQPPADWGKSDFAGVNTKVRRHIETMAFMYAMTDNTAYADSAINWMVSVAGWSKWGVAKSLWFNETILMRGYAFAYSVLRNYMTEAQRQIVIAPLAREIPAARAGYLDSLEEATPFYVYPNHWGTVVSTIGLVGLAIASDHPAAASWLDYGLEHTQYMLTLGGQDGGWYEGENYSLGLFYRVMPFLDALKRAGTDLFSSEFLSKHAYYYIYLYYGDGFFGMEDSEHNVSFDETGVWPSTNALDFMWRLAKEYNDGYAQQFAELYADKDNIYAFLWKSPTVAPLPIEQLPLTRHFSGIGYVVMRTGWGPNDLNIVFKSGGSAGHAQPNQNEFTILNNGDKITGSPGYLSGSDDATWAHNSLLVDGLGQGQEPGDNRTVPLGVRGAVEQVDITPSYSYVRGDASEVYTPAVYSGYGENGDLDKWLRHLVLIEGSNYLVVYDDVSASAPRQFDLLLNSANFSLEGSSTPRMSISVAGDAITIGGVLTSIVVEPNDFQYEIEPFYVDGGWFIHDYDILKVRPTVASDSAKFLTVHFPNGVLPVEEVNINNMIGVKVINGSNLDLILFSQDNLPVDEYIELGGSYIANDGGSYLFQSTGVRVQFEGYQVLRLRTSTGQPVSEDWDVNSDGTVNVLDMIRVGQHMSETGPVGWIREDVNKDGIISVLDMIIIGQRWT